MSFGQQSVWDEESVELLKRRWAEGWSAAEIASRLPGISRSAVLGKVHRLGLEKRRTAIRAPRRPRPPKNQKPEVERLVEARNEIASQAQEAEARAADLTEHIEIMSSPAPAVLDELLPPTGERHTIVTLTATTCRWPIGDPGDKDFHFCGAPSPIGQPYCEHHRRIAYQPVQSRQKPKRKSA